MGTGIRTRIVKIGNSQGVCIPKPLLEQSGIDTEVEIEVQDNYLVIRAAERSRVGWDEAFLQWQNNKMMFCLMILIQQNGIGLSGNGSL